MTSSALARALPYRVIIGRIDARRLCNPLETRILHMNINPALVRRRTPARSALRRLQDHLMLNVYGGVTQEDLARYSDQPDTLAGLIALRTGQSRRSVRAWLASALGPWHRA